MFVAFAVAIVLALTTRSSAQSEGDLHPELADRPIGAILFEGLKRVAEQEVRNNVRIAIGDPYDPKTVRDDVHRLNRLGQFKFIDAIASLRPDGSVAITYRFTEQQIIAERQVVGNRLIADADLLAVVQVVPLGPRDDFLIQTAKRRIEELYRKRGYYLTTVQIDETELDKNGLLIFRVIEGPRVKVRAVEFEGNHAFDDDKLKSQVRTRTALILFRKGELDEELLNDDVASLVRFYTDHGYLDVRVDRQVELSPDNSEAKVTFIVAEGDEYHLRTLSVSRPDGSAPKVFAKEQIAAIIELKTGDVYSGDLLRKSIDALQQSYELMSYLEVDIRATPLRVPDEKAVDLKLVIKEGQPCVVGSVNIHGNTLTRDRVVRRELRGIHPGLPIDGTQIVESENRLIQTRLFSDARITVQPPEEGAEQQEDADVRDVLVEVKERSTGTINFGVAVGSDAGLFGELSLTQNNFDISDWPESFDELITGRAFRGAGQQFNITLRPGTDLFQYLMSWTEPRLFDSEYALTVAGQYRTRFYDEYDEDRYGGNISIGRRFGDVWNAALRTRIENVHLTNIDDAAPTEVFDDQGPDVLSAVGLTLTRTTITTLKRPGSGSRLELALDQFGALGGDFNFTSATADYTTYFTITEDFLGRKSTLRLNARAGYLFGGDTPLYERFYLGGRSLRGFEFRTVSPKGIRADNGLPSSEPIGGEWMIFLGGQYEVPLFEEAFTGVIFLDSGTVTNDPGFDQYRVSIGVGIRLYIPQFGDVPIALDLAFPIAKEAGDDEQVLSFSAELPF